MNIDIGGIISRSFQIVAQNRVLWAIGLALTLFGSSINFNLGGGGLGSFRSGSAYNSDAATAALGTSALGGCLTFILLLIFFLVLRPAFEAASIYTADRASQGAAPNFNEAFTAGRTWMWRVLGLNLIVGLIIGLIALVIVILMAVLFGASFASLFAGLGSGRGQSSASSSSALAGAAIGGVFLLLCLVIIVGIPLGFLLSTTLQLGERAIVLENCSVGQAWSRGWSLLRANLGSAIVLALAQFGILLVVGLVGAAISFVITLPLLALTFNGGGVSVLVGFLGGLLLWAFTGLIGALPAAWNATLWTLFYRAVTGPATQPAGYPGGPSYPGGYPQQPQYPGGAAPPPPAQGGYTQPGQYPGGYAPAPPPAQGGYTQPGQYPGGYGQPPAQGDYTQPPAQGGYTQPGQYPGGYAPAPPPAQGGYTQPGQYPGGYAPAPPPAQGIYNPPDQYPGGYAPPADNPTQTFRPTPEEDDRARGGPGAGGQ